MAKTRKKLNRSNRSNLHQEIRQLGVLMEHTDHKVGVIAEQYGDIKSDISGIKKTLDNHTEMIGKLTVDLEMIKSDVELIKQGIRRKVDIDEFGALERRVALLEKRTSHHK